MASPPKVDAFLVCDHVHKDRSTGKHTVIGIWDTIHATTFPTLCGEFGVYANLTGLNGTYRFVLLVLGPDPGRLIARLDPPGSLTVKDPTTRQELGFNLEGIWFPAPGRFTLRLMYDGQVASEFTIRVEPPLTT
jgi:hypothetical protein